MSFAYRSASPWTSTSNEEERKQMTGSESVGKEPKWEVPFPYGYPGAVEAMASSAAPLLAGISLALIGIVVANDDAFGWSELAVALLVAAVFALLMAVQFAFWARQYLVTPAELGMWWPDPNTPGREEEVRWEQRFHKDRYDTWSARARRAYNVGLLCLLGSLAVLLVPEGGLAAAHGLRWVGIATAVLAVLLEALWVTFSACGALDRVPDG